MFTKKTQNILQIIEIKFYNRRLCFFINIFKKMLKNKQKRNFFNKKFVLFKKTNELRHVFIK